MKVMPDTLTTDQICDAAAQLVAPYAVCWAAMGQPGRSRDEARQKVCEAINAQREVVS